MDDKMDIEELTFILTDKNAEENIVFVDNVLKNIGSVTYLTIVGDVKKDSRVIDYLLSRMRIFHIEAVNTEIKMTV